MNTRTGLLGISAVTLIVSAMGCQGTNSDTTFGRNQQPLFTGAAFYDFSNQCTVGGATMHCCPFKDGIPSVMVGARLDQNEFKCQPVNSWEQNPSATPTWLDTGTQRNGMHVCPVGSLMRGLHVDRNLLACISVPGLAVTLPRDAGFVPFDEFVDTGTQDGVMHVCGSNGTGLQFAMAGIRADQNRFTCDTDGLFQN